MIFAIDPGASGSGLAAFKERQLVAAAYVKNTLGTEAGHLSRCVQMGRLSAAWCSRIAAHYPDSGAHALIAEWPRVYRPGKGKKGADPNDLLLLTAVDAAFATVMGCEAREVEPRAWKGTLGENEDGEYLVTDRLVGEGGELSIVERSRIVLPSAESLAHNVYDAVGIGLHAVGRSLVDDRKRVIAR